MTKSNVETFIIFQSLVGVGHLARCTAIAQALRTISHVTMFYGGEPVPGYKAPSDVDFVQLPPLRWDAATDPSQMPVSVDPKYTMAEIEGTTSELLVDSYFRIKPQIIITEYFPFAPRRFAKTLDGLFDAINKTRERPIVISSIRTYPRWWDADTDPVWINKQLRQNFSCVLHHTDPKLFPLTSLGPYIQSALSGITVWRTGFVRRPLPKTDRSRLPTGLLLTVGGGGGGPLAGSFLKRWISAARAGSSDLFPINVVCGPRMDANDRRRIHQEADAEIIVHDWVANLDELLNYSRAVVCTGGYNTLVEALSLKKPVLAFSNERGDQNFQVNALHAQGFLLKGDQSLSESEITSLMNELLNFRPRYSIDCDGANRSVEIVKHLLSAA